MSLGNLKFRAWDERHNEMIRVISINFDEKFIRGLTEVESNLDIESSYNFEDVELLQSTGLFDKNGKEIFEGDIVKHDPMPNPFFGNTNFEIVQVRTGEWRIDSVRGGSVLAFHNHQVEIIGNKYEHPHLLEE